MKTYILELKNVSILSDIDLSKYCIDWIYNIRINDNPIKFIYNIDTNILSIQDFYVGGYMNSNIRNVVKNDITIEYSKNKRKEREDKLKRILK